MTYQIALEFHGEVISALFKIIPAKLISLYLTNV